ncbi:Protein PHR1-LIKE 3, partial [Cucurbita argyrosperma subsp. sororia]
MLSRVYGGVEYHREAGAHGHIAVFQVTEALRVQMEVQRQGAEQPEVQRHSLQLRLKHKANTYIRYSNRACQAIKRSGLQAYAGLEGCQEALSRMRNQQSRRLARDWHHWSHKKCCPSQNDAAALENEKPS